MKNFTPDNWYESTWRMDLTPAEEEELRRWLSAHPELEAQSESEQALTRLLNRLPARPVSSNFTSLVMQAVDREEHDKVAAPAGRRWWLPEWTPRVAWAALFLGLATLGLHEYRDHTRQQMAESVETVSTVAALPNPAVFKDFETIHQLGHIPPAADLELLAALQ